MTYAYRDSTGYALGTDDWSLDHEDSSAMVYTGIWKDDKMVSIIFAKMEEQDDWDIDNMKKRFHKEAQAMVDLLNSASTK